MSAQPSGRGGAARRLATETKSALKTTEFWIFLLVALCILIAGNSIESEEGGADVFGADKVWLYITILSAAYFIGRGLAKSGSRDPYWDSQGDDAQDGTIADRIEAAVSAFKEGPQQGSAADRAPGEATQTPR